MSAAAFNDAALALRIFLKRFDAPSWHARDHRFKAPMLHCGEAAIEQVSGEQS
jgi:hypothetical protein